MVPEGYREYRKREFCRDVMCPVQEKLNALGEGSDEYEKIREQCKEDCLQSTHTFHKWLIDRGFLIIKKEGLGG